jgi:hypothetical protein
MGKFYIAMVDIGSFDVGMYLYIIQVSLCYYAIYEYIAFKNVS